MPHVTQLVLEGVSMEDDDETLAAEIARDEIFEEVRRTVDVDPDEFYRKNAFRLRTH